ncbi:MAG: peptide chain release factor 2 [Eubacteriales bacterium]|nr:peptide chain release factor 2 [Eubacteriales bacterium]
MVELDQFKYRLSTFEKPLVEVRDSLDLDNKVRRIDELDKSMEEPGFWDDAERSTKLVQEAKHLKDTVDMYRGLEGQYEDIQVMIEMGYEENDPSLIPEIQEMLDEFEAHLEKLRMETLLSGEYDRYNAILRLNAGAGGTESCDWCSMLYRMYCRWADRMGFKTEVLDFLDGDEAGIKSVTIQINGENAFGYLKSERGVHRLVRISPFNAAGKRQTSFVSCDVMPDIEEDLDVEINQDDLRIDTYRSSGAGGQHINKTSSAVRITHIPTGIVVQCQNERSQFQNKDKAMQMLKAKLYMLKQQENEEKLSGIRGDVKEIGWGNQIRSYVLQPYTMVKDLRTGEETGNAANVLDGNIDPFISAYLRWLSLGCPDRRTSADD